MGLIPSLPFALHRRCASFRCCPVAVSFVPSPVCTSHCIPIWEIRRMVACLWLPSRLEIGTLAEKSFYF